MKTLEESKAEFTIDKVWDALRDAQAELTVAADQAETLRRERDELAARCAVLVTVLADLRSLAAGAMGEANRDGAEFDIAAELADADAALSALPAAALRCQRIVEAYEAAPVETHPRALLSEPGSSVRIVPEVEGPPPWVQT